MMECLASLSLENVDVAETETNGLEVLETREWVDSLDYVLSKGGPERAGRLLQQLSLHARREAGVHLPFTATTPYQNTIPARQQPPFPGSQEMERRIKSLVRWNAMAMVVRANRVENGIGGHISPFASAATLYEVAFNHFFRAKTDDGDRDVVYFQGHATPGMYSRAYLEGRLSKEKLENFRRELKPGGGLSSYPHPWLMPDFWEFPTVSMGLGPIQSIYHARFIRYLENRGLKESRNGKVWAFMGDGEMDEPESLGSITLASREKLDNLIWVINCNLQRLDGPVRGNGKIIQELEAIYRGAGWNVIKVIWGREWDDLLARDVDGVLVNKMNTTVDGEFQKYAVESGAYIREHFFRPDPRLRKMVEHLSDDDLRKLSRGGHDYRKLYAAYKAAVEHVGSPTVILAKTIKGWTLGPGFEGRNATHQIKKMTEAELKTFRDRLYLDQIPESVLEGGLPPYFHPGNDSAELQYMFQRRAALDGPIPTRIVKPAPLPVPPDETFTELLSGTGEKVQASTTTAFARLLRGLLRDKGMGARVVPIIPDEARTFGLDALFSEVKIYAPFGQQYEPVDANLVLSYREAPKGQILEEGITEAGAMASFTAAGTAFATWGTPMVPFFIFYSMFGFQRVGDLIWAFGAARGRGFLLGATAGRTTLHGEGLQHDDGHSLVHASTVPNCRAYDPAFAYEMATLIRDGLRRMYEDGEDFFYYLTLYNENYRMPAMRDGCEDGLLKGLYRYAPAPADGENRAQILASGTAMLAAL